MKWSLYLGRVFGIKLFIHWTFLLLLGYIAFVNIRQGLGFVDILWSIGFILTVFVCLTLHELGHALTAKRYGINTKDIILLPIGGMARLESIPEVPAQELLVAIAGPIVNFVIAGLLYFYLWSVGPVPDIKSIVSINAGNFMYMLFSVNLILAIFNLIPAFPMDGGRMLRAILAMKFDRQVATRIAATVGQILAVGFVVLGLFVNPFLVIIGIFIFLGAQAEADFTEAKSFLKGYTVRNVIMHQFETLSVNDSLSKAVKVLLDGQARDFLVMDGETVVGTLNRNEVIKALYERNENVSIGEVMNKELKYLNPDTPLEEIYQQMQMNQFPLMPVVEDNHLIGVVDAENILEFIMIIGTSKNSKKAKELVDDF